MHRRILGSITALVVILSSAVLPGMAGVAHAQSSGTGSTQSAGGNAMRVAPVRSDLTVKPGETKTVTVSVTNITSSPAELRAIINDFGPSEDETGTPKVYLDEKSSAPSHGLKQYIKPISNITVQPQERKEVTVTISMPSNAAGGGYYGVVRFAPASTSSKENVSLSGSVGTLILVSVPGDVTEQANIKSFNVVRKSGKDETGKASNFFTSGKNLQSVLRIQNTGNVQIAPFGKAILKRGGKEVATYELNSQVPKMVVLPDSTRRFTIDLGDKTSSFGKYSLQGNFGYGSKGQLLTASTTFYVVPLPYILIAGGLLLLVIAALLIAPRWLKAHDRALTRKLRGKKR